MRRLEVIMLFVNFILAMLPILWLIIALSGLKMAGYKAGIIALVIAVVLAAAYWHLDGISVATAAFEGLLNALWPICLVIVAALFMYNLTVETGAIETIKNMLTGVSRDKRVIALLIGWGFGHFMEGMAGFGTAVAIPAAMLAGIGLNPLYAVAACLVINAMPTSFGSVGVPTLTLSQVTGIDALTLSNSVAIISAILMFASSIVFVCIIGRGIKAMKGMWMVTIMSSVSFVIPWYITAKFVGPELPDVIGGLCSLVCIIVFAKKFNKVPGKGYEMEESENENKPKLTFGVLARAWSPYLLAFVLLLGTSALVPVIHNAIAGIKTSVVVYAGADPGTLSFSWINTPGVMLFIAAIIGGFIQRASAKTMLRVFVQTLKKYWKTIVTICSVMCVAKIMSYSGMITDIAKLLVVATGSFFPFVSPAVGVLGGLITGSGTTTCVLFGNLQVQTAHSLSLNPIWMASANVMGSGIGKMISPQSIAIGTGAIGMIGSESKVMGAVIKYFLLYTIIAGAICLAGSMLGM